MAAPGYAKEGVLMAEPYQYQGISSLNLLPVADWPNVRQVLIQDGWQVIATGTYQETPGIGGVILATFVQGQLLHKIPIASVYGVRLQMP